MRVFFDAASVDGVKDSAYSASKASDVLINSKNNQQHPNNFTSFIIVHTKAPLSFTVPLVIYFCKLVSYLFLQSYNLSIGSPQY